MLLDHLPQKAKIYDKTGKQLKGEIKCRLYRGYKESEIDYYVMTQGLYCIIPPVDYDIEVDDVIIVDYDKYRISAVKAFYTSSKLHHYTLVLEETR
jgi:hypothetical protein